MVGSEQAVSLDHLLQEVAICSCAIRQGVDFVTMKRLWDSLGSFVRSMLRAHKGVLLPCLGTFHVGPAMLDSQRQSDCIVPAFRLLEGRFAGVSHEVIRMRPAGNGLVVPPNYQLMSTDLGKHRSTCQRLIKDLLQRVANHILMEHAVNIPFPTVGNLVTNKAGRVQFKFEKELLGQLKSQPLPLRPTTSASSRQTSRAPTEQGEHNITDEQVESAAPQFDPPIQTAPRNPQTPAFVGSVPQRTAPMDVQGLAGTSDDNTAMWNNALHDLATLCISADKAGSGCVGRIQLEWWLQRQGRALVSSMDAASVLDLLQVHSYGSSGKFIVYGTFLEGLRHLIQEVREEKMLGNGQGQAEILRIQTPLLESTLEPSPEPTRRFQGDENMPGKECHTPEKKEPAPTDEPLGRNQELLDGRNPENVPIDHEPYFLQNHTHSLSRGDCDKFNQYHFRRLISSRGGTRELPPKVGEEPLTEEEVKFLRSGSPELMHRSGAQMASEKEKSERRQRGSGVGPGRAVVPELLGEHLSSSDAKAKELEMQKRKDTRAFLRSSWERQAKEKAKVMELFQTAEDKWPYMPSQNPHHDHYPIKSPRYVSPHYVRPVEAPDHSYNLPHGCSLWSGL